MAVPERHLGRQRLPAGLRFGTGPNERHAPVAHEFSTLRSGRIPGPGGSADEHHFVLHAGLSESAKGRILRPGPLFAGGCGLLHDADSGRAQFDRGRRFFAEGRVFAERRRVHGPVRVGTLDGFHQRLHPFHARWKRADGRVHNLSRPDQHHELSSSARAVLRAGFAARAVAQ